MLGKLTITVTKTAQGVGEYVQIMSPAAVPVNIVLIADEVVIEDHRASHGAGPTPEAREPRQGYVPGGRQAVPGPTPEARVVEAACKAAERVLAEVRDEHCQTEFEYVLHELQNDVPAAIRRAVAALPEERREP